jgi:hypothetical protein
VYGLASSRSRMSNAMRRRPNVHVKAVREGAVLTAWESGVMSRVEKPWS